jgi:type II secretory ATPase GspE/PulE/Tfp pilus assembly ATPase PilB-like protein
VVHPRQARPSATSFAGDAGHRAGASRAINQPNGACSSAGPTRVGRVTTLYAALTPSTTATATSIGSVEQRIMGIKQMQIAQRPVSFEVAALDVTTDPT